MEQSVYMAGTELEAGHHVQALRSRMAVSCLEPTELLNVAKPGDLVLFYSEHFDRFRDACIELQRRSVATLYLLDGILEWRNAWENRSEEPACPWTMSWRAGGILGDWRLSVFPDLSRSEFVI